MLKAWLRKVKRGCFTVSVTANHLLDHSSLKFRLS